MKSTHFSLLTKEEDQENMASRGTSCSHSQAIRQVHAFSRKINKAVVNRSEYLQWEDGGHVHVLHMKDHVCEGGHDELELVSTTHNNDISGRERLQRQREEVAGRVLIPDNWGQEKLLKDWIDCSSFEALLLPNKIASARKALVAAATSHQDRK
ncbi:hypothetical protein ACOSP7_016111 [Xanthoceras sorbifolium]